MRWTVALLAVLLSACSAPTEDRLRMGLASAPVSLDPRLATDATSDRVNRLLYRQLVDFDPRGMPVPSLARWERLTPLRYRFRLLGEGRRFTDGRRLTAADVKATYDFILDPANASPHRGALEMIASIEVVDSDTLDFRLSRPDPLFPSYLTIGIVPAGQGAGEPGRDGRAAGSGAFRLVAWPSSGRLELERLSDGQRIALLEVKDPSVRVLKLLRGEIDMTQNDLPPELVTYLETKDEVRIEKARGSNFSYLGFNLEDPVTGRLGVRRAVAHAIDRDAIIRFVLAGGAVPAQALLPPDHWAGAPGLPAYQYNPELARAWLRRAGYGDGKPLRLVYKTSSDPFRIRLATVIQSQLAAVGIEVDLRSYDWGTFYGDIKAGSFQMYSLAWVGVKTPDVFRYVFHSESLPPEGANRGRFSDPEVDGLIAKAEGLEDLAERASVYRDLQARLLDQLPYVPLWYEDHVFVARADVTGYALAADGNYDGLLGVRRQAAQGARSHGD